MPARIHPTSIVDRSAELADGVNIGPFCIIGPNVTIGEGTELRSHIVVESHTRLGCHNVVFQFATVGGTPQDRKFAGEVTWCEIGDHNQIRECVTIHRGTANGGGLTRVGSDNLVMAGAHIAHDCIIGSNVTVANEVMLAGHVHVGDWAAIGGGAGLHHYVTIGRMAFVAGMARMERDAPPFVTIEGSPARVRIPNETGLVRRGVTPKCIRALRIACTRLYTKRSNRLEMSINERIESLRSEFPDIPEMREFCDAVEKIEGCKSGRVREQLRQDDKRSAVSRPSGAAAIRTTVDG